MLIVKAAAIGKFRGRTACDLVLRWSQQLLPFLIGAVELGEGFCAEAIAIVSKLNDRDYAVGGFVVRLIIGKG
jgi:hypothetical protein